MRARSFVIVLVLVVGFAAGPYLVREAGHWWHYRRVETQGEYRSQFLELTVPTSTKPGLPAKCRVSIKNAGTQPWVQGQHYFALGVFDKSKGAGRFRLQVGNAADDAVGDRVIIHQDIPPGGMWERDFELVLSAEPGRYLAHFQMVKEGAYPGWFGEMKEVTINVR